MCLNCGVSVFTGQQVESWTRPDAERPWSPPILLAPLFLLFRPSVFFQQVMPTIPGILIFVLYWFWGMASAVDRMDFRALSQSNLAFVPHDWPTYWAKVMVLGAGLGFSTWWLGGWWYRMRLILSNAFSVEKHEARRAYAMASSAHFFPALAIAAYSTLRFERPLDSIETSITWMDVALLITSVWAAWLRYAAARSVFGANRIWAFIWFLMLPLAAHLIVFVAIMALMLGFIRPQAPSTMTYRMPNTLDRDGIRLAYPAEWTISDQSLSPDTDGRVSLDIEGPGGASMMVSLYSTRTTAHDEFVDLVRAVSATLRNSTETDSFAEWGRYSGHGCIVSGESQGRRITMRIFVGRCLPGVLIEVRETCIDTLPGQVESDFELIRSSMRVVIPPTPIEPQARMSDVELLFSCMDDPA